MNKAAAVIWLLVIGIGGAALISGWNRARHPILRTCGHPRGLFESVTRYLPIARASHCCFAGRAVFELRSLHTVQEMFVVEKGCYAKSFDELTNDFVLKPSSGYSASLLSDGTNWSATIAQSPLLPGSYLLTQDGFIYFNQQAAATTNDIVLIRGI